MSDAFNPIDNNVGVLKPLKPPPIQEPFRLEGEGQMISPPWIMWMQDLVNKWQMMNMLSYMQLFQTSDTVATMDIKAEDVQVLFESVKTESSSSLPDDDNAKMIAAITTTQEKSSKPNEDAELLCWVSF